MPNRKFGLGEVLLLIALSVLHLSSCASTSMTYRDRSNLIEQLQEARRTDLSDAMDPGLDPAAQGDYMTRAEKAQTAIDDLSGRTNVPHSEISEALFVPPKTSFACRTGFADRRFGRCENS